MQARHLLLGHASRLLGEGEQPTEGVCKLLGRALGLTAEGVDENSGEGDRSAALERFEACFEGLLDEWKQHAFTSAFIEPARYFFDRLGAHHGRDHVNVHGLNWYLVLLSEAVGC